MKNIKIAFSYGVIFISVFLFNLLINQTQFFKNLEYKIRDSFFIIRNNIQPKEAPTNIIIVSIDEASFQELKTPWPWPRKLHAELIDALLEAGAKIIAFDIIFSDPTDAINDTALKDSINKANNVILASNLEITEDKLILKKQFIEPQSEFINSPQDFGLANVIPDQDNFVRRTPLRIEGEYIFAYQLIKKILSRENPEYLDDSALLNRLKIEDPVKPIIINYLGPARSFQTVSYYQALEYKEYLPKNIFKDKIVLVGLCLEASPDLATKSQDTFATPFFTSSASMMFGVEIQANIINTLISGIYIEELNFHQIFTILVVFCILSGILTWYFRPLKGLFSIIFLIGIYFLCCIWLFLNKKIFTIFLPVFLQTTLIYVGNTINKYFVTEKISLYDPLTSLYNRRALERQLEKSFKLARRHNYPISLAMADIDHFKKVNDTYGHQVGDIVLKKVAHIYTTNLKTHDIVGRYGGEEFVIILPHTTIDKARDIIERLRKIVAETKIEQVPTGITSSFGLATLESMDDSKTLIQKADNLLYKAKELGRNRVVTSVD